MIKINKIILFFFFIQSIVLVAQKNKNENIETFSKQHFLDLNEAEMYYNFRKNLFVSSDENVYAKTNAVSCSTSNNPNIGFELGNYSNWNIQRGTILNSLYDSIVNISPATTTKSLLTTGTDPITFLPYNSPFAGNFVIKLNDAINNSEATFMSTKFMVTPTNNILKTAFSSVFMKTGHECGGEPYFRIQLFSCSRTNLVKEYLFIPNEGNCSGYNPGFFNFSNSTHNATDWKKLCFDLRNYIGEEIEVNVIISDCKYYGHYGYTYFDAEFGSIPINSVIANTFSINSSTYSYSTGVSSQCFSQNSSLQCPNVSSILYPLSNGTYSNALGTNSLLLNQGGAYNTVQTPVIGCDINNGIVINVKPTLSLTAASPTLCPGTPLTFTVAGSKEYTLRINGNVYNTYLFNNLLPANISLMLNQNPSTVTLIGTGGNNCIDSTSQVFSLYPQTTLTTIYTPSVCAGSTTVSATGAVSYTWNPGGIVQTATVNAAGVTNIGVIGTDVLGCRTANATFSIVGLFSSPISISGSNGTICQGDSSYFSISGATSYTWSNGYTGCCQYLKPTLSTPGFTAVASKMCSPTTTFNIPFTVLTGPAINTFTINYTNSPVCSNSNFTVQGVGSNFYFKWGATGQYNNFVNAFVTNANPTFTAIALGTNGCNTQTIITMPLLPTPTLAISGSTAICSGQSASLTALGANSYTWDYFQAASTYTTGTATNNFNVTLYGVSSVGCATTSTFPIIVEKPGITASPNTTFVCLGVNTLTLSATDLGSGGTYSWSTGATTQSIIVSPTVTTSYSVQINSPICGISIYTTTITVIQSSPPILSYTFNPAAICLNKTNTLTVSGANSYAIGSMSGSSNTNTFTFTPTSNLFSYNIGITGTYTNGCSTYTLLSLPVNPSPFISVFGPPGNQGCKNSTVNLTAAGAVTYTWSNSTTGSVTAITPSVNMSYSVAGTSLAGCTSTASSAVILGVNPPTITITPPTPSVCPNSLFSLTASAIGGGNFVWSDSASTAGAVMTNSVNMPTVFTVSSSTFYCTSTKTVLVNLYNPATLSILNSSLCTNVINSINYIATPPGGTLFVNGIATNTIFSALSNTYNVTYKYQDTGSCVLKKNTVVTIDQSPCLKISASNYTSCVGSQITFTGTPSGGFYSGSNLLGNVLTLPAAGNYTVSYTYTGVNNCVSTICTEVNSSLCTDIPNYGLEVVNIYPNPAMNAVTIDNPNSGQMLLKIYDINGRIIINKQLENTTNVIDISTYSNGLYIFYLESDSSRRFVKIIKE